MASNVQTTTITIGGEVSKSLKDALSFANDGVKRLGDEAGKLELKLAAMKKSGTAYTRMRAQADALRASQEALERVEAKRNANLEKREKLGASFKAARGTLGTAVTALAKPVENASGFARQNQQIGVAANLSRAQVSALGQAILQQSRATNQGADDLQRSIKLMVAAGMDAQSAQASLGAVGRTTTVTGASIDDVAQAAAALQQSFDIDPSRMQNALDVLVVNSQQGSLGLKDMAQVLPVLGSSFEAMKLQGTSAAATLGAALEATLDSAGGADKAASNMKSFMSEVLSPDIQEKAKKSLNLDLHKIIGDAQTSGGNPFDAAMQGIIQATAGDQKKIGTLFSDAQAKNFVQPMIENWDTYIRVRDKALNGSAGTTDAAYADAMQTDPQKIEGAKIAVDNLSKAFGAALLPAVGEAAVKLTELLNGVTSFVHENPKLIANTTQIVVGMLGMRTAVLGARYAWTFLQGPILGVQKAFQLFRGGSLLAQLGRFGPMAMRIASVFRVVATAVGAIGGGPIAVAVAALTAGALLVRKYWEPIKAFLGGVWEGLSSAGTSAMGELMNAVAPVRPAWEAVSALLGQAWDWLSRMLAPAQYTGNELSRVGEIGKLVGEALMFNFRAVIQVAGFVAEVFRMIGEVIGTVAGFIVVTFGSAWDWVSAKVSSVIDTMMAKIVPFMEVVGTIMDKVGGVLGTAKDKIALGVNTAADAYGAIRANGGIQLPPVMLAPASMHSASVQPRMPNAFGTPAGRAAPEMPSPTPRSATTVQQQQTNHITIHQQPGESSEAVARRTADELQRRNAVAARGGLADRN
ncbi:phage tail tape measure protein [Stenotrophomonas maltophilia]|uniref:phage tail tape measure protein n=1 Tax=Stenotrophomonas maltophilia TaxID=40324 RepID=UPI00066BE52F|nr:phage tail tape measure protein [Stenotrophomonas maltophilia]ELK2665478.1 phage tail tape measure protein [Stenotrophomonas maltophilia]MBH1375125.1 phage tail tape measure protein [Stenotrophomonas maltophilia]MBH1438659.1 phage tail tape measure protein [Stenotrophomonas maltophilia]MBH1557648.1 phage tail tape measure protein [Stenotrophomonas maltophilia]MBN4987168.1 phage tail tape measure protein [Stenotrophomonas maltophilia]